MENKTNNIQRFVVKSRKMGNLVIRSIYIRNNVSYLLGDSQIN